MLAINVVIYATLVGLILSTLATAFIFGRTPERWGAIIYVGASVAATLADWLMNSLMPVAVIMALDTVVASGFLILAVRFNSLWLGAVMVLQGAQLALHSTYLTDEESLQSPSHNAFALAINLISLATFLTLIGASFAAWRRRRRAPVQPEAWREPATA